LWVIASTLAFCFAALACSFERSTPSGQRERQASFVIGARMLGGLAISPDTSFRRMRSFFGSPASESFGPGWCRLQFRNLGLDASFTSFREGVATPANCKFFNSAVATTREWRTTKGVRAGTTLRALRRAYPRAFRSGEVGGEVARLIGRATAWHLTPASGQSAQTILVAYVKRGRIVALGIKTVGH
jgi:hypothetical protein